MPTVRFLRLVPDLPLPSYAKAGDAGMDLRAARDAKLCPGERLVMPTGVAMELPDGFEGQIRPRSGLAAEKGLTIVNSPGTIDNSFRGELKVILLNTDKRLPIHIARGDRIAQLVIAPVSRVSVVEVSELTATDRGTGGFGSTGA